jgi:hypothetical protein
VEEKGGAQDVKNMQKRSEDCQSHLRRVALEWKKEEIPFSISLCRIVPTVMPAVDLACLVDWGGAKQIPLDYKPYLEVVALTLPQ